VRGIHFGLATLRQRAARFPPMADVSVGNGNEQNMMPFRGPHGSRAAGLEFAIVRVRTEADNAELAIVRWRFNGGVKTGRLEQSQKQCTAEERPSKE
jgi:hypothetical protein